MRNIAIIVGAVATWALAGCAGPADGPGQATAPGAVEGVWLRTDGQSGDNPVIARQFEVDRAACMAGAEPDRRCMAARGYILVPANQADARAAQLRAAAGSE